MRIVTGLLYTELKTDTLSGRTVARAAELDARKVSADASFEARFAAAVEAHSGKKPVEEWFPEDLLRGGDSLIRRACFEHVEQAFAAALDLKRAPVGEGSSLRMAIGHVDDGARVPGDSHVFHDCRALCSIAQPGQILLDESLRRRLEAQAGPEVHLRPVGPVRLPDLSAPRAVCLVQDGDEGAVESPKGLDDTPHNLPVIATQFVGRVRARRDVPLLLLAHPIVTIVGGGGAGKTRLALQMAAETAFEYPGGVWFVQLASLADPELVGETVAAALSLKETSAQPSIEVVASWLSDRRALLVLDNCEHLIEQCRQAAAYLIEQCPQLRVLATSRRELDLDAEFVFELPAMELPDADGQDQGPTDAVQLFAIRARERARGAAELELDPDILRRLCHLLEGNPLAIELATARINRWSISEIFERVSERFDALGEDPDPPHPRQRSLWATIEWSHRLLTPSAQRLFRRLSVFRGGATAQHIVEVLSDEMLPESQVEGALNELVAGHLLLQNRTHARTTRFRALETVRTFAATKLDEAQETAHFSAVHAARFREMLIRNAPLLNGPEQVATHKMLHAEHSNIQVALEWHVVAGELEHGLRIGVALRRFWTTAGFLNEGRYYFQRLLDAAGEDVAAEVVANARYCLGTIGQYQSDYELATSNLDQSLEYAEAASDFALGGKVRNTLGSIAWRKADIATAQVHYQGALALLQEMEHEVGITTTLSNLAVTHFFTGEFDEALRYLEQSVDLGREIENERSVIDALNNMAIVHGVRGKYGQARSLLAEAVNALQHIPDARRSAMTMNNLAQIAYRQGRHSDARQLCESAIEKASELGDQGGILFSRVMLGALAIAADDLDEADMQFSRCLEIMGEYGEMSFGSEVQLGLGRIALARRDLELAEHYLKVAETSARAMPHRQMLAHIEFALARLALMRGDVALATQHHFASLEARYDMGNLRGIAESLEGIADLAMRAGDSPRAIRLHAAAHKLRDEIGAPLPSAEARAVEVQIDTLRERLGPMTFDAAWAKGEHASIDDVVAEVLD